jgi:hypothetical protein
MKPNDERRKVLSEYLGLCWHEGRMPINCGYRCVKCGDTYVVNRTFDNDPDMMALFRKIFKDEKWDSDFVYWLRFHPHYDVTIPAIFLYPERFCNLVAEWLEVTK